MLQSRAAAVIVLLIAASVLGLSPILVRLTETGPAAAGFWRLLLAAPVLALLTARPLGEGAGAPSRWMLLAGLFFALDMSFWHYGLVMTSVANATVLCNLTPVVVTLFAWFAWKERPRPVFVLALVLAMAGAVAMAAAAAPGQGSNPLLGDLFSVSVSIWYSGYFLAVQAARRAAGAMKVTFWSTLAGIPLMAIAALALGEDMLPATIAGWGACAGLALTHVVGQGGVAWALGRLPAALTAVTILIQPVAAAILAWLVFGEVLSPIQALGGALVLAAIVLAQRSSAARTRTGAASEEAPPANP